MNAKLQRFIPFIIVLVTIQIWAFFQFYYQYSFYYKEQNQLFLLSADYLSTYFDKPAWAACLAGDYITQFFYYMYAGAAILAVLMLLLGLTTFASLRLSRVNRWAALAISVCLMVVETSFNLNHDFRLSSMMCVQGGIFVFLIHGLVINRSVSFRIVSMAVLGITCLWMFSFGVVAFIALVTISDIMLSIRKAGNRCHSVIQAFIFIIAGIVLVCLTDTYPGVGSFSRPRQDLEDYLEIENLYYFGRYDELVEKVKSMQKPTEEASFYYYLVMAKRGELPNTLRSVNPVNLGTLYQIGPKSTNIEIKMVGELYFALGDMTLAEREALLSCVFSHNNRNVRMIKRLAEANLVAGDHPAAMKYLRLLDKTIAYRKWATANRPGRLNPKLADLKQFAIKDDTIRIGTNCRDILENLLKSNPRNRMALDYLLCTDYLVGARDMFINDINKYYIPQYGQPTEPMYRELYKMKSEE